MGNMIEVGEYIRNNKIIAKVIGTDDDNNILLDIQQILTKPEKKTIKHSKQLIDIIEPGDILEIEEEGYEEKYECLKSDKGLSIYVPISDYYKRIEDLKIKRVLTKEQFRQNSYEVGGEDE